MSTPPKEPKPSAGPTLEHTFLGVAPAAPEPASTPPTAPASSSAPPSGSAIIAAPMISVSGDRKAHPAAPAAAVHPALPARPGGLQGGWQTAGVARPPTSGQTALQGTPGAWSAPTAAVPTAAVPTAALPTAALPTAALPPPLTPGRALPPRPESYAQGARLAATPAAATPNPRLAGPATPSAGGGLHHTALASEYLRHAREAALGSGATPVPPRAINPALPSVERPPEQSQQHYAPPQPQQHYAPPQAQQHYAPPPPPREYEPAGPPTQMPVSEPLFTAASAAPASPAVTASPPATAQLSEPSPMPYASPTVQPAVAYAREPEPGHGPRSIGTQASVAPPPSGSPFAPAPSPSAAFAPQAPMAPAPSPVRSAAPNPMAGTMLERIPSVPGNALPAAAPPATSLGHTHPGSVSTRFEQVPSARGSLGQQATGFGLHIPIDQSATDWGRTGVDQASVKAQGKPGSPLRLILLAALALVAIGFAAFGKQLLGGARAARGARAEVYDGEQRSAEADSRSPDQATLTNLPSSALAPAANAASAGGAAHAAAPVPAAPALAAATPAAPLPTVAAAPAIALVPSVSVQADPKKKIDPAHTKPAAEAHKVEEAAATPESRLAAQAARHVLAARFADALPLYRQLQQSFPQNTAYAAMVRVLEQKTAATSKPGAHP